MRSMSNKSANPNIQIVKCKSGEDDIHNLVDKQSSFAGLGVIREDKAGASPDQTNKRSKAHGGMAFNRLSTDEWNEHVDQIEMEKPVAKIRRESILNIPLMNASQKDNIKNRIFNNHNISKAKLNVVSRTAGRKEEKARYSLARANSIIKHYHDDVESIDNRFRAQL